MPPVNAATEEMNKIRPNARSRMEGTAHWASRNGARRFTASISSNWAAVMSSSGWTRLSPALLTSTSTGPSASAAAWTS